MRILSDRFNDLIKKVTSENFYYNKGLGNEIPFYIFDYNPEKEMDVREFVKGELLPKIENESKLNSIEIDLFELMIQSLKDEDLFERTLALEEKRGSEFFYDRLSKSFNVEIILEYFKQRTKGKNIVLITGIGKLYPILRPSVLLYNLQLIYEETKVILFLPGEYTGKDISFLGIYDDSYYRAFKI